eukprot:FR739331.1.p1 GENE.FR739331.1~~FR739331.1.p1  ORF type:complete len:202 (+),score=6.64 FR739331.1:37-606(+)
MVRRGQASWVTLEPELQHDMDGALTNMSQAAERGHVQAMAFVGWLCDSGWGVARNDCLAFEYYSKAAERGHVESQYNTGICYRDGLGCQQSYVQAAKWLEKSAIGDDADAQLALGFLYEDGQGVPRSLERATQLYSQSAIQGNGDAALNLKILNAAIRSEDISPKRDLVKPGDQGRDKGFVRHFLNVSP